MQMTKCQDGSVSASRSPSESGTMEEPTENTTISVTAVIEEVFNGYLSDLSDSEQSNLDDELGSDSTWGGSKDNFSAAAQNSHSFPVQNFPPLKRRRLEIPTCISRPQAQVHKRKAIESAIGDIKRHIHSKKTVFDAGQHGLQAYHAGAIQSCLWMAVRNKKNWIDASECAAESQGFSKQWGSRMVHYWVRKWVNSRELPVSLQGHHGKTVSLYDDPAIRDKL